MRGRWGRTARASFDTLHVLYVVVDALGGVLVRDAPRSEALMDMLRNFRGGSHVSRRTLHRMWCHQ